MPHGRLRSGPARAPAGSRRGRPAALLACLLGLAALLIPAGSASANHHKLRVGVIDGVIDPQADVRRMGTADVEVFRTMFSWKAIETQQGTSGQCIGYGYDWSYTDRVVNAASRRGISVLPFLIGSPEYAVPRGSTQKNAPHSTSPAFRDYRCFVRAVAARYGRGGAYPTDVNPAAKPITQWQVWNEPNLKGYAARREVNPREYARLVKATRREIFRTDRRATIVLAGMPEAVRRGMDARPYLKRFYRVRRIENKFDVVALHPYAENARGVKGAMIRLRRVLKQVGDRRRPAWLTEMGWTTAGDRPHFINKSRKQQARELTKAFRMLRRNQKRFKLGTVNWFRWRDASRVSSRGSIFDYAGLYVNNGKPKPSCRAFVKVTGGRCRPITGLGASTSASSTSTSSLSVRGPAGDVRPSRPE